MKDNEQNTEKAILEAAEAEFLEKGYANTKMLSIARRAGVAHSMLHYYYRNKENLFQTIITRKVQAMLPAYHELFHPDLSFEQMLRSLRDARDRFFWSQNPQMPYFMLTEIISNRKNRAMLLDTLEKALPQQLARMLLITIDASSLSAISICRDVHQLEPCILERLQMSYREHNMQLILEALRPSLFL